MEHKSQKVDKTLDLLLVNHIVAPGMYIKR